MNKIALLTASTISSDDKMSNYENHFMTYLTATLDEKEYTDKQINLDDYFELLINSENKAQTSQPSTGELSKVYEEILEEYDSIIVIAPSQFLSGTYQNMILASEDFKQQVYVIDSRNMAMNENIMFYKIQDMIEDGLDAEIIFEKAQNFANNIVSYALPGSFDYLKKSGRVNISQAILGNLLNIRLTIKVECEGADVANKSRGLKKTFLFFDEEIQKYKPTHVVLSNLAQNEKECKLIFDYFKSKNLIVHVTDSASIICATHFGPRTTGIAFYKGDINE